MNCTKCGEPTDYNSHLCESCYARRSSHLHCIIKPQARQQPGRLLALFIAAFLLSLLFAALLYGSLHAADLSMQILISGQPASHAEYTLDGDAVSVPGRALLHGFADVAGMIHVSGIATGTWTLYAGCLVQSVEVGEVQAQVLQQADASCRVWVPVVSK